MKIYSVTDAAFRPYGKILEGYDTAPLCAAMRSIPMPEQGTAYEPSIPVLEAVSYTHLEGNVKYKDGILAEQPFLLHYDLITLSFILAFTDGTSAEYFSDFLLCVSKSQEDATNIQQMLQELIAFDLSLIHI